MEIKALIKMANKQQKLRGIILKNHPVVAIDRVLNLKIALQVEIGEFANEWRGFKIWSNNQEPNTRVPKLRDCPTCDGGGIDPVLGEECAQCGASGKIEDGYSNPLLEEYVDCLHLGLDIGIEMRGLEGLKFMLKNVQPWDMATEHIGFSFLFHTANFIDTTATGIPDFLSCLLGLGKKLGLTDEKIIEAFNEKHEENIRRQKEGY